jgi:hypothetical protein
VVGEDVRLGGGGRGWPAALVIPAAGQLAAVGAAALPAFSAYNSDASVTWKWVASAATIALGFLLIRGVSFLLPDGPAPAGRPARAQHAGGHRNHPLSSGPGYLRPFGPQGQLFNKLVDREVAPVGTGTTQAVQDTAPRLHIFGMFQITSSA